MKNEIIGFIYAVLGIAGMLAILFYSSPAVTSGYLTIGALSFGVLFMYGLNKALSSHYYDSKHFIKN